jgi:hypothetical protein
VSLVPRHRYTGGNNIIMKEFAMHAHRSRTLFIAILLAYGSQAAAQDAEAWIRSLKNMSQQQGQTLLQVARDLLPHGEQTDARIVNCLALVDARASDPQYRHGLDESVKLTAIASRRRTGDKSYIEITDNGERVRLAKMLSEGGWLRQFRAGLLDCLKASE